MKHYGIEMEGTFLLEKTIIPAGIAADEGRLIYDTATNTMAMCYNSSGSTYTYMNLADAADLSGHISDTGTSVHGLGTMSTQNSTAVSITGGSITGLSSQFTIADGTVGSPGFAFSSDTDTGIFRSGSGMLNISCNGTEIAEFDHRWVKIPDDKKLMLGTDSDMRLYHDGTNNYIELGSGPELRITGSWWGHSETIARFVNDSGIYLYYNN